MGRLQFSKHLYRESIEKLCIPTGSRVLLLKKNNKMIEMLREAQPDVKVYELDDIGLDNLLQDVDVRFIEPYDYVLDDGFLEESGWHKGYVRGIGLHLNPFGALVSFTDSWSKVMLANEVLFTNWFGKVFLLKKCKNPYDGGDGYLYAVLSKDCNGQVIWLQSYFSKSIRKKLSILLTRMEFGIETQNCKAEIRVLCRENGISDSYLKMFINSVCIDCEKMFLLLDMKV